MPKLWYIFYMAVVGLAIYFFLQMALAIFHEEEGASQQRDKNMEKRIEQETSGDRLL